MFSMLLGPTRGKAPRCFDGRRLELEREQDVEQPQLQVRCCTEISKEEYDRFMNTGDVGLD